jgi:hypothetical protein
LFLGEAMIMPHGDLFIEEQKFRKMYLWIILITVNAFQLIVIFQLVFFGEISGEIPGTRGRLIIFLQSTLVFLITLLMWNLRLDTAIREDGIYYRYFPFQRKFKKILWSDISKCYVRRYNPIMEYGGWGLRLGLFGKGQAFNVAGNMGLQLVFNNGKRFLIGTQKPDELDESLKKLGKLNY